MRPALFWMIGIFVWIGPAAVALPQEPPQPEPQAPQPEPEAPKPAAAPKQEAPPAGQDRESLLRELTYQQLRELKRVWIEAKDSSVQAIVDEFRRQSGQNIVLDGRNIPENYRVPEFIVRNAPFREALEHFLKIGELVIVEESANIIRIERPIMMSMAVTDTDIKDVLAILSKVSGANLILAPDKIQGKVTLSVNNVPWNEILQNVVKTLGYETVRERYDVIRIISSEELVRQMELEVFELKYLSPPPTYKAKFEQSKFVHGVPFTGPSNPADIPNHFTFLRIVEASLSKDAGGAKLGETFYDFQSNAIIVRDTKPTLDRIRKIVELLDSEPEMVMLSMKFLSTRNEDLLNWGTSWFGMDQLGAAIDGLGVVTRTFPTDNTTNPPGSPSVIPSLSSTSPQTLLGRLPFGINSSDPAVKPFYFLTEFDTRALFRAFRRDQYTKLLQEPTLSVLDGTEATIFVGESVPFAVARVIIVPGAPTQVIAEPGPSSPIKVGFQVLVVPRILKEQNQVIATVIPENVVLTGADTQQPGFERFTVGGQDILLPRTAETTIVTRLKIDNNQTAVIGGLVVERVSLTNRGIPGLQDIPVLNFLFKSKSESKNKEHLLIFLTPKIVRNRRDLTDTLDAQRRLKAAQIEEELKALRQARVRPPGERE